MRHLRKILFQLFLSVTPICAFAQITSDDMQVIQDHTRLMLKEFLSYYYDIGNTDLTEKQRKVSMQAALALFIGHGDSYYIKNESGERSKRKAAMLQIVSSNNTRKTWRTTKSYLNNLYASHIDVPKIDIQAVDIIATNKLPGTNKTITLLMKLDVNGLKSGYHTNYSIIFPDPPLEAKETTNGYTWSIKLGDITINRIRDY